MEAPTNGSCENNFDGAVFSNVNKSRVDVVARDCNGLILASTSQ